MFSLNQTTKGLHRAPRTLKRDVINLYSSF